MNKYTMRSIFLYVSIFLRIGFGLFLGGLGILIFFSLITYNQHDSSLLFFDSSRHSSSVHYVVASLAALLFYWFGFTAFLIPIMLVGGALLCFWPRYFYKAFDRVSAFVLLVPLLCILGQLKNGNEGNVLGFQLTKVLLKISDHFVLFAATLLLSIACVVVLTRLSLLLVSRYIYQLFLLIYIFGRPLQRYFYYGIYWLCKKIYSLYGWCKKIVDGSIIQDVHDVYEHEQELQEIWQFYEAVQKDDITISVHKSEAIINEKIEEQQSTIAKEYASYVLPNVALLALKETKDDKKMQQGIEDRARILEEKLRHFGVFGSVVAMHVGPVVTLFEYQPQIDSKISKILALEDDLAMALEATSIRIIAPIPGKSVVGFEVAHKQSRPVLFASLLRSSEFIHTSARLPLLLGEDTLGRHMIVDLAKMPHLLVGGSTGSGKSVALNTMLVSLLYKHSPETLKLVLIDPKRLEFASYNDIAHLLFPIITLPHQAIQALKWVVQAMEQRYNQMAQIGINNIADFHKSHALSEMPFIVVVIDELADLMMTAGKEVESLIVRLTQMARAAGIHIIAATQRPSVDVVTGLIKVNFPSRIAFRVTSKVDSRTILDCIGAERLLGKGDMLFLNSQQASLERVHGAFITLQEISMVVNHIKTQRSVQYINLTTTIIDRQEPAEDEILYTQVLAFLGEIEEVSISLLQRKFRIGYNRSARIIERLELQGKIISVDGGRTRRVMKDGELK